jgi:hypothetical protein
MSIQYLFILDFEGNDIIKIHNDKKELNDELIEDAKAKCLTELRNKIMEFKIDLFDKDDSYKFFSKKNDDMIKCGVITENSIKDYFASNLLDKMFAILKNYDVENRKELKSLEKEIKNMFTEYNEMLKFQEIQSQKIKKSSRSDLSVKTFDKNESFSDENLKNLEDERKSKENTQNANKTRLRLFLFFFGFFIIFGIIILCLFKNII